MSLVRPERERTDRRTELGYFGLVEEHRVGSDREGRGLFRPRWF
jgi:hypothetical protein